MKIYPNKLSVMIILSSVTAMSNAVFASDTLLSSTNMSDVGFTLTGDGITLSGNDFTFPEEDHYCAKKKFTVDYTKGEKISLDIDAEAAEKNGLSLNIMAWGDGEYKSFGAASGESQLTSELTFDTTTLSVGFCRYNNKSFETFTVPSFSAVNLREVVDEIKDLGKDIIVHTTNLESEGFDLTGDNISLDGNNLTFPDDGHYCLTKKFDVEYKSGDVITTLIDQDEAAENGLSLNVKAWADGQYKGFSGTSGEGVLTAELPFDATTVSVGFCRYNNKSFDEFIVSEFEAYRGIDVIDIIEEVVTEDVAVYPGCLAYSEGKDGDVLVLDDSEPRTLQELFDDGTVVPGMTVELHRQESELKLTSMHDQFMSVDSPWLTVIGVGDAGIGSVSVNSVKNIRFSNLNIGNDQSGWLASTYDSENIIFDNNFISAGDNYESWGVQEWQEVGSGILFNRSKCSSAFNNELKNLRHGIHTYAYDEEMRHEYQSMKALLKGNLIQNISGDFFQAIGSDVTVDGNTGLDQYVSVEDGDPNHDDFVQGFAYPLGTAFVNVKIINNFYQATTDYSRPLQSPGQGVVIFDGLYTDFEISNNTLISDMWHGITVFWGKNGVIKNNTTLVLDDTSDKHMWIYTAADKSKEHYPENVKVENNVSTYLNLDDDTEKNSQNNVVIPKDELAAQLVNYNVVDSVYDIAVKKDSYYYSEGVGSNIYNLEEAMK